MNEELISVLAFQMTKHCSEMSEKKALATFVHCGIFLMTFTLSSPEEVIECVKSLPETKIIPALV